MRRRGRRLDERGRPERAHGDRVLSLGLGPRHTISDHACALFWLVHVAAVGALIVIALNTVLNKGIFGRLAAAQEFLSARNFRLELVTEMLQGSRIIKMLGYESGIFDAIKGRREKELGKLAKILRLQVAVAT